jgi:hypothetical protein
MGRSKKIGKPTLLAKQVSHIIKMKTGVIVEPMFFRVSTKTFNKCNINLDGLKWYMLSFENDILVGSKLPADVLRKCSIIQKSVLADNIILLDGIK